MRNCRTASMLLLMTSWALATLVSADQLKCGLCGNPCRIVSGIFNKQTMAFGYNLLFEIPAGACKVNVSQLHYSQNFLALRYINGTYIFNGNWAIKWSGSYQGAGTTFRYYRGDKSGNIGERIETNGPIDTAVEVMLLYRHTSKGIQYRYAVSSRPEVAADGEGEGAPSAEDSVNKFNSDSIAFLQGGHKPVPDDASKSDANFVLEPAASRPVKPRPAANGRPNRKPAAPAAAQPAARPAPAHQVQYYDDYSWREMNFSKCSKSCAGGSKVKEVVCVDRQTQAIVTDDNCNPSLKPVVEIERCNTVACPAEWFQSSNWSSCSATCGPGKQTRVVYCAQRISDTENVKVSAERCPTHLKPPSVASCSIKPCGHWRTTPWTQCSNDCSMTWRTREVQCVSEEPNGQVVEYSGDLCQQPPPSSREPCPLDSERSCWFSSQWIGECDTSCNGNQTRNATCVTQTGRLSDTCAEESRPVRVRPCHNGSADYRTCGGQWFANTWSPCSTDCTGHQVRQVLCMKKYDKHWYVMKDDHCPPALRPESKRSCDVQQCHSQWYATEWSQCSRTCGKGHRRRRVLCLDSAQNPSSNCHDADRPVEDQECEAAECPKTDSFAVLPPDENCQDKMEKCSLVLKAGLCRLPYYTLRCCATCPDR